jgi:PqqD family protein of HPr-rel-A system
MWRLTPGQTLRFRQFDDEFVIYNDLSGDTHLLGDDAAHVLSVLQHGPASADTLLDSLATALGSERDAVFDDQCGAILSQLAGFFLIERVPC